MRFLHDHEACRARRRRADVGRLAAHLAARPDERHYGWDTSKATGIRTATTYHLLQRFLDNGWLADGWEEKPEGRPPRRFYVVTDLGRIELAAVAIGMDGVTS